MQKFTRSALMLGLVLAPAIASAQVIDQQSLDRNLTSNAGYLFAQTFTPSKNNIDGVGVLLYNSSTTAKSGLLAIQVYGGASTGYATLYDGTVAYEFGGLEHKFVDVFFPTQFVNPSELAYVQWQTNDGVNGPMMWFDYYNDPMAPTYDAYTRGFAYQTDDGTQYGASQDLPDDDVVFREYYDPRAVVATPEPASMVLLATGLVGIVGAARRRKVSK